MHAFMNTFIWSVLFYIYTYTHILAHTRMHAHNALIVEECPLHGDDADMAAGGKTVREHAPFYSRLIFSKKAPALLKSPWESRLQILRAVDCRIVIYRSIKLGPEGSLKSVYNLA